ncbi:hypothetical protein [Aestuariivirga sp.]|uniref:hypothetical protein n=1 Tax=Aestuariivirga sp. TaxID=2650926 RepID=UPI003593115B
MALLNVAATTDFSAQVLNDITDVTFTGVNAATATFSAGQFDDITILNSVHWTGNSFANSIVVNGGSVDASAWEFTGWSPDDSISFGGTAGDDAFVASRSKDVIEGGRGSDVIVSGHATQGDVFHGGRGTDTFRYLGFTTPITDMIDGGLGSGDRIELAEAGTYDFLDAGIAAVEELAFANIGQTALFDAAGFAASGIVSVAGSAASNAIEFHGAAAIDLSAVTFSAWDSITDTIQVLGTAGNDQITGSAFADQIFSQGGSDTIDAGAGRDIIHIEGQGSTSVIQGGAGRDRIVVSEVNDLIIDIRSVTLTSVEDLEFDGQAGGVTSLYVAGGQIGAGKIDTITGSAGQNLIYFYGEADGSSLSFVDWNENLDVVTFSGSIGDETTTGTSVADTFVMTDGADILHGGDGGDTFQVRSGTANASREVYGDGGIDTLLVVNLAPAGQHLTLSTFNSVERLDFGSSIGSLSLSADAMGGATGIQEADSGDAAALNALILEGATGDLSGVAFTGWQDGDDIRFSGTAGDDSYTGSYVGERFIGSLGADVYDGEGGNDEVDYGASANGVSIDLQLASASGGSAGGDTLSDIEWLTGSAHDDRLYGSSASNVLDGGLGNDTIRGRVGGDILSGDDGIDTLDYAGSTAGVTVSLAAGTARGGHAANDSFDGFENITGSSMDDRLTGNSGNNVLQGGGGADLLIGGNGQDELQGGGGLDTFSFSSTNHSQAGGATRDTIASFSQTAGSRDVIDVSAIDARAGSGATDEAFVFVAAGGFTGEGQIIAIQSGADTVLRFNTSGLGGAEMEIVLTAFTAANITAADFIL